MILEYNGFDLARLGDLTITQSREFEGGDAPQRARVTLRVGVDLFQRNYDDNYQLVRLAKEALRTAQAELRWHNEAVQQDYVKQTAALLSDDLPEEWGEYHQRFNLVFTYLEQDAITQNTPLTLQPAGGTLYTLNHVTRWQEQAAVERFDTKRKHRRETHVRLTVSGQIQGDPTTALTGRRAALAAQAAAYQNALNQAEATLVFGTYCNRAVRVETFEAEVDQSANVIQFTFTAGYTLVPDEAGYATAEFTAEQKDNMSGELLLTLAGKIQSATEAQARTKLTALIAAARSNYGFAHADRSQLLQYDVTPNGISANADGDTYTELTFSVVYRAWRAENQGATFLKTGSGGPAIPFGHVRTWTDHYNATRFNGQRSQRQQAFGRLEAAGTWSVDPGLTLSQRRAALLTQQRAMRAEVNGADGTLTYGDWTQVVRVGDLKAEINQAETGIEWSFTAEYSLFPNEGSYATCEFQVAHRANVEDGDKFMQWTGRILAPNEALARAKLATLRAALLTIYGYTLAQRLRDEATATAVQANGDATVGITEGIGTVPTADADGATTFIELQFSEEYRARITGTLVSCSWTISTGTDVTTGLQQTVYSGTVTAAGTTADGAYATALAKAVAIGAGKEGTIGGGAIILRTQISQDRRQSKEDNVEEFVRLTFSYEYQSKIASGAAYLEVNTQFAGDTFGMDVENVSGFVVAADASTAQSLYTSEVRAAFNSKLIRNESTAVARAKKQTAPSTFTTQELRLDFSFQAFSPKAAGKVALKYSLAVSRDLRALSRQTSVRGSCFADTAAHAELVVDSYFGAMSLGALQRQVTTEDFEWTANATYPSGASFTGELTGFIKLDFEDEYLDRITGDETLLEMRVSSSVRYSSTRWAVQPLPYDTYSGGSGTGGYSIPQPAGVAEGWRTVRGSVSAASLTAAEAWARRHRGLLTGDADGGHYPLPEEMETEYEFVPRVDGIAKDELAGPSSEANVQVYRVNFTFGEILPKYPAP